MLRADEGSRAALRDNRMPIYEPGLEDLHASKLRFTAFVFFSNATI